MRNITFCLLLLASNILMAQGADAQEKSVAWNSLSAIEQQQLAPMKSQWSSLPAERQTRLRANANRWAQLFETFQ